ncbi:MAG: hypothetical protein Q7R93_01940 [bacterium]|nr:hypothetical protein [bacterium]
MKSLRLIGGIALIWYVVFGALLMLLERRIIYFPSTQDFESCAGFADAEKITYQGARFYYKKVSDERVVVFYHGNAGSACDRSHLKEIFEQSGYSYLFVEYSGFSDDSGVPSKKDILGEVTQVREFLLERGYTKVVSVGESIGSGPAAYHAHLGAVEKVALLTPYYELADMGGALGKVYPLRLMMRENYTTGEWMKGVTKPVLVLYASGDESIPFSSTKRLYDALITSEKKMVGIDRATHNTMYRFEETFDYLRSFLRN